MLDEFKFGNLSTQKKTNPRRGCKNIGQ